MVSVTTWPHFTTLCIINILEHPPNHNGKKIITILKNANNGTTVSTQGVINGFAPSFSELGISGGHSGTGTDFSQIPSVFHGHYHSIIIATFSDMQSGKWVH